MSHPPDSFPANGSGAMFHCISGRYDLLNRILSLGMDRRWRRQQAESLDLSPGELVLDVACGTGDVMLACLAASGRTARVLGLDPAAAMLAAASRRRPTGISPGSFTLCAGVVDHLPLADGVAAARRRRKVATASYVDPL